MDDNKAPINESKYDRYCREQQYSIITEIVFRNVLTFIDVAKKFPTSLPNKRI